MCVSVCVCVCVCVFLFAFFSSINPFCGLIMQPSNQLSSNLEPKLTTCHSGNYTNRIMMKFLPWCKLKKSKNVFRDSLSCDDISFMMTFKKDHDKKFLSSKLFSSKKVKSKSCINYLASPCPIVSFVNKGDGLVSVDLMNRVMVNENELYSMNVTGLSNFSSANSLSNSSSSLSSKSTPTLQFHSSDESECNTLPEWFVGSICRDAAISILSKQPIGAFIVRESITKPGCYALSVRVPKKYHVTGVAHYLIIRNSSGIFKIKVQNTV